MRDPSISIIVPALNEEHGLAPSVRAAQSALDDLCPYEIIILDDGSRDRTGAIAEDLAANDSRIRVVHNPSTLGIGASYRRGVELARCEYVLWIPADDETPAHTIRAIGRRAGTADVVLTHTLNWYIRPMHRWILSHLYTAIVNVLFGLRLRYYNGNCLIRTTALRTITLDTFGFSYMTAIIVRLLRQGYSYAEIGITLQPRGGGGSTALRLRSFIDVARSIGKLWWEVRVRPVVRPGRLAVAAPREAPSSSATERAGGANSVSARDAEP